MSDGLGDPEPSRRSRVARPAAKPSRTGLPAHLSVSQIETLASCGMKYKLQRLDGEQEVPAWWNVGGTAFHATIEAWERGRADGREWGSGATREYFSQALEDGAEAVETSSGIRRRDWRAANKGTENGAWWADKGAEMVNSYVLAHTFPNSVDMCGELLIKIGAPCLELPFSVTIAGVEIKGFIDQVRVLELPGEGSVILVRDLKAGKSTPGGSFQLGVYAQALRQQYGITLPMMGEYWMARKGEATVPVDLDKYWPPHAIAYQVTMAQRQRQAGIFAPSPSTFCGACGVSEACPTRTGVWPILNPFA